MTTKQLIWILAGAIAVAAVATGICLFLHSLFSHRAEPRYIECECEPDCT